MKKAVVLFLLLQLLITGAAHGEGASAPVLVSYLGPAGTYTEEAAQFFFCNGETLLPKATVQEAIDDMRNGVSHYAVIPQENTLGGAVISYVDALIAAEDAFVVGEIVLPISQTLMSVPGATLESVRTVCSHAQGLTQSAKWREAHLPNAAAVEMASTAAAASYVAESKDPSIAAVAAPGAAALYGLEILARDVQITDANKTRFYVLSSSPAKISSQQRAVLVATCAADQIDDIIVLLHQADLELITLHDRPEGSQLGRYRYVIEVVNEAGLSAEQLESMRNMEHVRFAGCFDVIEKTGTAQEPTPESAAVILGDEQFETYLPLLEGKRVALFSNHTGIVGDRTSGIGTLAADADASLLPFGTDASGGAITYGEHILDALIAHGVNVTAVFSPEHGFRGTEDAGATVSDSVDEKTGVPILSLYGDDDTHAPAAESMDTFDTLVVDMQDVGLRYYTYYISMYYLMDACAAAGKTVMILDRPNPNGFYVDGPILQADYRSNVGQLPVPIVYGMTWGELAQMINGEGWLTAGKNACDLTVIPCLNYTHQTKTSLIRNPSPNIKDMRAVYLYASTCFFENTAVSVGRGTAFPFEAYGSPYLSGMDGYEFSFTPVSMSGAAEPPFLGEACYGVDLRSVPLSAIWEQQINLNYLATAYSAIKEKAPEVTFWGTPDEEGRYWIDKLTGSAETREQIEAGKTAEEIKAGWQTDIDAFKEQRRPYLLYDE